MSILLRGLLFSCLTAGFGFAQVPEDPGPHPVGWTDVSFSHPLSGNPTVDARLYYPAMSSGNGATPDASAGPYPLVGFLHGYFAFVDYYDDVCSHLASYGFFVASVATESGFFMSVTNEAKDARAMLTWTEAQALPGGTYEGMILQGSDWSTVGHSNGCVASFHVAAAEPRIARMVLFEPNWLNPPGVSSFTGPVMVVGATLDLVAPASINASNYYNALQSSSRCSYVLIEGSGHNGALDFPFEITTLPHSKAQSLHRRLAAGFLRAEVQGEFFHYEDMVGAAAELEPLDPEVRATEPVLWSAANGSQLGIGLAGRGDDVSVLFAFSSAPGSLATPFGQLGIDLSSSHLITRPMTADGSVDLTLPYDPSLVGLGIFTQGLRLAANGTGALSQVLAITL